MRKSYTFFQAIFELTRAIGFTRIQGWAKRLPEYDSLSDEELVLAILRNYERWHEDMDPPEEWLLRYGKMWHDTSLNELKERLAIGQYTAWGFAKGALSRTMIPPELWPSLTIDLERMEAINVATDHYFAGVTITLAKRESAISIAPRSLEELPRRRGRRAVDKSAILDELKYRIETEQVLPSMRDEARYLEKWNYSQADSSPLSEETIRKFIKPYFPNRSG